MTYFGVFFFGRGGMNGIWRKVWVLLIPAVVLLLPGASARAEQLSKLLPEILKSHNLVLASEASMAAAKERIRESRGGFFPNLNVSAHYGAERIDKPFGNADTGMVSREVDLTVTQLLWDFGLTRSNVQTARLTHEKASAELRATRQELLLRAITAYLEVKKAAERLDFAKQSIANIAKQTELESMLVKRGAGLSTDVLQAKTQLSGAEQRRVQAAGLLRLALNAFHTVFDKFPGDVANMAKPILPNEYIPKTVEEAVKIALTENPRLIALQTEVIIAQEKIKSTTASVLPKFEAVAETKYKEDVGGTVGHQYERVGKVQLSWPINLGLTAINSIKASTNDALAISRRIGEFRDTVEEEVRRFWKDLLTNQEMATLLTNQANISAEFLELARKERQLGNRSLLDVLAGETTLINANSDAVAAQTDVAVATYSLLKAMGKLDLSMIVD